MNRGTQNTEGGGRKSDAGGESVSQSSEISYERSKKSGGISKPQSGSDGWKPRDRGGQRSTLSLPIVKRCKNRKKKHMKNTIPQSIPALLTLAGDAADGAGLYHAAIPLLQNTKANIQADIDPLVDAIMAYGAGKAELASLREAANAKLEDSRKFLTLGRDNLKPHFGSEYNQGWDIVGLVGSLSIPRAEADVLPVLTSFKEFFAANAAYEVPPKVTATLAEAFFSDLKAARSAVNAQETVVGNLMAVRDGKAAALYKRIRGLISELEQRIDGLDERWLAFGLNKPDAQEKPEVPLHVSAILIGPNAASVKWDASARATYYRVFKKVNGVDTEYVSAGSPADLDFTLENLPANSTIEVVVAAVNSGGESAVSEKITIVTQ